ncbi:MAG TPA: cytochrome c biogenesis protein CcsA [Chthonomonadaceae bacterium]|nr:cytochrome c biogenesis protein CcsA [Chthonomonadaceae bacterium]
MWLGVAGVAALWVCLISALLTICGYGLSLKRPAYRKPILLARALYAITALAMLSAFALLGIIVYTKTVGGFYRFQYAFEHTSNDLMGFYRLAATWSGQEGSFLLWGSWTALLGFFVFWKAGRYEARVMPFFVTVLAFLAAILIYQSPFAHTPRASIAELAANPGFLPYPPNGQGLHPSLQNYWMTIHPPTIFFGFASLLVPFCYAVAALIWKDYEDWTPRVMPYALLTCLTLGVGLFMGGYWAYETQGWHGFWAWDPVENASFFPWLAITALLHGLVVQKDRGGMARTTTFLGLLGFWLFLVGTFLTRSGALAGNGPDGQMLSIHAFDNIKKGGLVLMVAMLIAYGALGLCLWLWRVRSIPTRKTVGDTLLSRDFAFFLAVILMLVACAVVTFGTTWPLFLSWTHRAPSALKPTFYNRAMLPLSMVGALLMGIVPWLAYRKTSSETFLKKMLVPWFVMLAFGFVMLFLVMGWQRDLQAAAHLDDVAWIEKTHAWISPAVQRVAVMALASLGFLAALSNAMLAFRVFRSRKPLSAGGWVAHVGIGLMMIGIIVSNTFERTKQIDVREGAGPSEAFGYKFDFERFTGKSSPAFPLHPDLDGTNAAEIRVTPPASDMVSGPDGSRTYLTKPRWFVYNMAHASSEDALQRIRWPHINKYWDHDLYVGYADDPWFAYGVVDLTKGQPATAGPYTFFYAGSEPQADTDGARVLVATLAVKGPDGKILTLHPSLRMTPSSDGAGIEFTHVNSAVPQLADENGNPGVVMLNQKKMSASSGQVEVEFSLPQAKGIWVVPLEITYKPWINLVWIGVIVMGIGVLIAMIRRALEARLVADGPLDGGRRAPSLAGQSLAGDDAPITGGERKGSSDSGAGPPRAKRPARRAR